MFAALVYSILFSGHWVTKDLMPAGEIATRALERVVMQKDITHFSGHWGRNEPETPDLWHAGQKA